MQINDVMITVLMPVYNTKEEYLREAIESILNQTYQNFEFLIINDGSTNNAKDVILSYDDKRIKYFENDKNRGLIFTLNRGLELAQTPFLARMDADDISSPQRLEKQLDFMLKNTDVDILGTSIELFPEIKKIVYPINHNDIKNNLLTSCCMAHPTILFRMSSYNKAKFKYDEDFKVAEDYELWSRLVHVLKLANLSDVGLHYRWHDNNISSVSFSIALNSGRLVQAKNLARIMNALDDTNFIKIAHNVYLGNKISLTDFECFIRVCALNFSNNSFLGDYDSKILHLYLQSTFRKAVRLCDKNVSLAKLLIFSSDLKMLNMSLGFRCKTLLQIVKYSLKKTG